MQHRQDSDSAFAGSVPEIYDRLLVPLIFEVPAVAYCQGTPLRNEIEARGPARLVEAAEAATNAIGQRFGPADLDSKICGYVVTATRC